jgi:hypothetical protein
MSETPGSPENPLDLSSLCSDLEKIFAPSWVKEASQPSAPLDFSLYKASDDDTVSGKEGPRGIGDFSRDGDRSSRDATERSSDQHKHGQLRDSGKKSQQGDHRTEKFRTESSKRRHKPRREGLRPSSNALKGWEISILPVMTGVEGLARQIRSSARAFALFDLAKLVLDGPERFYFELRKKDGAPLFMCSADNTLWLSESSAANYALHKWIDRFYRLEREESPAPKGNFPVIAQCGVTGILLGPPNYHDYQMRLRKVHREHASHLSFEAYLARVRMVRDESLIEQWRSEQCVREVWVPLDAEGNPVGERIRDSAALAIHFREHYQAKVVVQVSDTVTISGRTAADSERPIAEQLHFELEKMRRFPLPLANCLARELAARGLQIFKSNNGRLYVCIARPRYLDRSAQPVSERLSAILDRLLALKDAPRAKQWASLLEIADGDPAGREAAEAALLKDLLWLLREGYVTDFHGKNLHVNTRPKKKDAETSANPKGQAEGSKALDELEKGLSLHTDANPE